MVEPVKRKFKFNCYLHFSLEDTVEVEASSYNEAYDLAIKVTDHKFTDAKYEMAELLQDETDVELVTDESNEAQE
jgi:hypothetical protein